jgi:hypothetical protein
MSKTFSIRLSDEEFELLERRATELGVTRTDLIRMLLTKFDETVRAERGSACRECAMLGVIYVLESIIFKPEVIARFIRANADILSYPTFVVGLARFGKKIVVFTHEDKYGKVALMSVMDMIKDDLLVEERYGKEPYDATLEVDGRSIASRAAGDTEATTSVAVVNGSGVSGSTQPGRDINPENNRGATTNVATNTHDQGQTASVAGGGDTAGVVLMRDPPFNALAYVLWSGLKDLRRGRVG